MKACVWFFGGQFAKADGNMEIEGIISIPGNFDV
jgi:hypothetical protein